MNECQNKNYWYYERGSWILLSSVRRGGFKQFWWNPLSQAPSQRMISLPNVASFEPQVAQNICDLWNIVIDENAEHNRTQLLGNTETLMESKLHANLHLHKIFLLQNQIKIRQFSPLREENQYSGRLPVFSICIVRFLILLVQAPSQVLAYPNCTFVHGRQLF